MKINKYNKTTYSLFLATQMSTKCILHPICIYQLFHTVQYYMKLSPPDRILKADWLKPSHVVTRWWVVMIMRLCLGRYNSIK